jgi:hypothetical protein
VSFEPSQFKARFVLFQERDLALREAIRQERIFRNGTNLFTTGGFVSFLLFSLSTITIQRFIIAVLVTGTVRVTLGYLVTCWCARELTRIDEKLPVQRQGTE